MLVILCALTSYLVPETAWIRHVMRFQSQVLFRHDWSEADSLRPYLTHVAQIPRIPNNLSFKHSKHIIQLFPW